MTHGDQESDTMDLFPNHTPAQHAGGVGGGPMG